MLFNYRKYEDEKKEEEKVVLMGRLGTRIGDTFSNEKWTGNLSS